MEDMMRKGLLILSYGGPQSLQEVEKFLEKIFKKKPEPHLLNANLERYRAIGGFSPVCKDVKEFCSKLQDRLDGFEVGYGFRYSEPSIDEAVLRMFESGIKEFFLLPLNAFYSEWSFKGYLSPIKEALSRNLKLLTAEYKLISSFFAEPKFIDTWKQEIEKFLFREQFDIVVFTAHSLPLTDAAAKRIYPSQIELAVREISTQLSIRDYRIVYQSKGKRGGDWLGPDIVEVIDLLKPGTKLLVVPIGFIQENVETLYDLDIVARRKAEEKGLSYARVGTPLKSGLFEDFILQLLSDPEIWQDISWEKLA